MNRALPNGDETMAEAGLLSFYDRLRQRVAGAIERRGGRWGAATAQALMLVPDVFVLLVRLTVDRRVPVETRRLLGGALAYFLLPVDLLPELALGAAGYLDDLVLVCIVLAEALGPDLERHAARHWSGSGEVRSALGQVTSSARELLGDGLFARVEALLARRGVRLRRDLGDDLAEGRDRIDELAPSDVRRRSKA